MQFEFHKKLNEVSLSRNFSQFLKVWWRLAGSNRWPPACKAGALPAELNPHISTFSVLRSGGPGLAFLRKSHGGCNSPPDCCQEPPFESILVFAYQRFPIVQVLTSILGFVEVVGQNGLEPSTSRLSVVCSSQLSYWPVLTSSLLRYILSIPCKLNNALSTEHFLYWP